jgi:hypothetical protein
MFEGNIWNMKGGKPPLIEAISTVLVSIPNLKPIKNYYISN